MVVWVTSWPPLHWTGCAQIILCNSSSVRAIILWWEMVQGSLSMSSFSSTDVCDYIMSCTVSRISSCVNSILSPSEVALFFWIIWSWCYLPVEKCCCSLPVLSTSQSHLLLCLFSSGLFVPPGTAPSHSGFFLLSQKGRNRRFRPWVII